MAKPLFSPHRECFKHLQRATSCELLGRCEHLEFHSPTYAWQRKRPRWRSPSRDVWAADVTTRDPVSDHSTESPSTFLDALGSQGHHKSSLSKLDRMEKSDDQLSR